MRELNTMESLAVNGGEWDGSTCPAPGNTSVVGSQSSLGDDLTQGYEGLVAFVSHVIERVANSID